MSEKRTVKDIWNNLADFAHATFDVNRDGLINYKDLLSVFPANAVGLSILIIDLLALVAEYRVWDVGMLITHDPLKAAGYVAVSALPFYLGQVLWLYPLAGGFQQLIGGIFVLLAAYTSVEFSIADLTQAVDVPALNTWVARLTGIYILGLIAYVLADQRIRDQRLVTKTKANAERQAQVIAASRVMLSELRTTMLQGKELVDEFGEGPVQTMLEQMMGKGKDKKKRDLPPPPPGEDFRDGPPNA